MSASTSMATRHQPSDRMAGPTPRRAHPGRRDLAMDIAMLAIATTAGVLSAGPTDLPADNTLAVVAYPLLVLAILGSRGAYRPYLVSSWLDQARAIIAATAVAAMAVTFARVLLADDPNAGTHAVRSWLFAAAYLTAGRGALTLYRRARGPSRPTLIIGAGRVGHLVAARLRSHPELGLLPVGFLDDRPLEFDEESDLPVLGTRDDLESVVTRHAIEHAIVSFSAATHEDELEDVRRLRELRVSVSVVPRLFEAVPDDFVLERIAGLPMGTSFSPDPRGWRFALKYALDRPIALLACAVLSPVLLVAAAGTFLTLGRPVLFSQRRVGLDGRPFHMLKFRTMRGDPDLVGEADAAWAHSTVEVGTGGWQHGEEDGGTPKRTTRFGQFLRRTGIDELPQLFNVLRGEMSMVGPRPERESYVRMFGPAIRRYDDRHRVRAGITGWAQVHGLRGETSLKDRVEWDNYYIENWSLWLDVKILLLTLGAALRPR